MGINIYIANKIAPISRFFFILTSLLVVPLHSSAATWSVNTLEYVVGDEYKVFSEGVNNGTTVNFLTFQHVSEWALGDNFFFVDFVYDHNNVDLYGELYSTFSLSKILSKLTGEKVKVGWGPVTDVGLTFGVNAGNVPAVDTGIPGAVLGNFGFTEQLTIVDVSALIYGGKVNIDLPGFDWFAVVAGAYNYLEGGFDTSYQVTPVWGTSFFVGPTRWKLEGYMDFFGEFGDTSGGFNNAWIFSQTQLMMDVGYHFQEPDKLYIGTEFQFTRNKFGFKDVDESFFALLIEWKL